MIADSLRSVAAEYQAVVRSTRESDAEGRTARRRLARKFHKLRSRDAIDGLKADGLMDAAEKLDELFSAGACVFNLVAVSIGVDEAEVLDIDIDGPHAAAIEALRREAIG